MLAELNNIKLDKEKTGFFRFKRLNGHYLLTNDLGNHCLLDPIAFKDFLKGDIEGTRPSKNEELLNAGFIRNRLDLNGLSSRYSEKYAFLNQGPSLHIVVTTLRCDHSCLYCQAGSKSLAAKGFDMDISVARKVVDTIFESTSPVITIEFQGGEPLVNFETVKYIIEYALSKNKKAGKKLSFSLVSNLTFMTKERLKFFMENNVIICSSLDGPASLHDKNRICAKNNSYKNTVKWLKAIINEISRNKKYKGKTNALVTITKSSLKFPREIVDEYVRLGLEGVHLRPINPFGVGKSKWRKIGFSGKEFFNFYKKALDHIITLNLKGKDFYERTAKIFLTKILTDKDLNFLDLRSPCGAGIGQLAYNFNGDVYTCDEARMLSAAGDESFRLGNVFEDGYAGLINNDIVKTTCVASCLDGLPACSKCVYKPYCGVCPIYNYVVEGNIFSSMLHNERCKTNMLILDYLFELMQDLKTKSIFYKWVS